MGVDFFQGAQSCWFHFEPPPDMDMFPVRVVSAGRMSTASLEYRFSSATIQSMNPPGYHSLQYSLSGAGRFAYQENGRRVEMAVPAGSFFLMSHDLEYEFWYPGGEPWEWFWITLEGAFAERALQSIAARRRVFAVPREAPPILCLQALLTAALRRELDPYGALQAGCEFLVKLKEAEAFSLLGGKEKLLREAGAFVRAHIESVDVAALARAWGYSAKYFQVYFKRLTGGAPGAFIQRQRLGHAAMLLESSSMKLAAVAGLAGFTDASHLCRVFKSHHGLSPEQWRLRQRRGRFQLP